MTPQGTLIGFDFGERRIGVAVGETTVGIANPVGHIDESGTDARFEAIARLVDEWQPAAFVVGLPRHSDGSPHEIARLAHKFARRLEAHSLELGGNVPSRLHVAGSSHLAPHHRIVSVDV